MKTIEKETIDKEVSDALHMLLHCALKDKEFETQKEQFHIVYDYIKKLEKERDGIYADYQDLGKEKYNLECELEMYKDIKDIAETKVTDLAKLKHIREMEAELKNVVSRKKYRQTKKSLKGQIRKLNAVIDEMAEYFNCGLAMCEDCEFSCSEKCSACIKEYFYKKEVKNNG